MKLKKSFAPQITLRAAEPYSEANRAWQGVPSIARIKGGRLFLGFMSGGIYEPDPRNCCLAVYSDDGGESWSEPEPFMATSSQRPCFFNLPDGVGMIASVHPERRDGLRLLFSEDGLHFEERLLLEDRERVSYAEVVQDEDGTLYIAYDRERNNKIRKSRVVGRSEAAKEILFARIPAVAWRNGAVTAETVRARVVTKARINTLENRVTGGQS